MLTLPFINASSYILNLERLKIMKNSTMVFLVIALGLLTSNILNASVISNSSVYDSGNLAFSSNSQSTWGTGSGLSKSSSIFLGAEWQNASGNINAVAGNRNTMITPAIPSVQLTPYIPRTRISPRIPAVYSQKVPAFKTSIWEPRIWVPNPSWSKPWRGYYTGCGCTKTTTITPAIPRKLLTPAIPAVYSPAVPATYSPYVPATYADTRTGVDLNIESSGRVGLEFGYNIDSGTIDSEVDFSAIAELPENLLSKEQFFSINTESNFSEGVMQTQSPQLEAYFSTIMELSGSVDVKACGILAGCAEGSMSLPDVNLDQRILSIDANSIKILDDILPNGDALAKVPLSNQSLSLSGAATVAPSAVGFKLKGPGGVTIASNLPESPAIEADLAKLSVQVPSATIEGELQGDRLVGSGRDDIIKAQFDLDGAATLLGALPPVGGKVTVIDTPKIKIKASLDGVDVDAGPTLGIAQDFELIPTLMATIAFSNPIMIAGLEGLHDSWTGRWDSLPDFALLNTTTFTPTFWLDTLLKSSLGLDLGLVGTMDLFKLGASGSIGGVDLLSFGNISLNDILGIDNSLFETHDKKLSIFDKTFALQGFNQIQGEAFTIGVQGVARFAASGPTHVPEPNSFLLIILALCIFIVLNNKKDMHYA